MDIRTPADYQQALDQFTAWMDEEPADLAPMLALRAAISAYEQAQGYELPEPQTLVGRLELEMYRRKLNKKNGGEELKSVAQPWAESFAERWLFSAGRCMAYECTLVGKCEKTWRITHKMPRKG